MVDEPFGQKLRNKVYDIASGNIIDSPRWNQFSLEGNDFDLIPATADNMGTGESLTEGHEGLVPFVRQASNTHYHTTIEANGKRIQQ